MKKIILGFLLVAALGACTSTEPTSKTNAPVETSQSMTKESNLTAVTMENFIHADSTRSYLKELSKSDNKVNVVRPNRELASTDSQDIIRMNADTLYTRSVIDVKGGATIKVGKYDGYQNIMILDINHSEIATLTGDGELKIDETMLTEGQHVYMIVRTGLLRKLDNDKMMYEKAHKAQDNITISANSSDPYVPSVNYDFDSLEGIKTQIFKEYGADPSKYSIRRGFGKASERSEKDAQVVIAIGWGGLSKENASYSTFMGKGIRESYTFSAPNLKYDDKGFFSFTMYTADGWIGTENYAINSDDMVKNEDGTYTLTILASGEKMEEGDKNVVRSPRDTRGWMGIIRMYQPTDPEKNYDWNEATTKEMTEQFSK